LSVEIRRTFLQARGIQHQYTHVRNPDQNGKVERSHRTDKEEFYTTFSPEMHTLPE
jgi:transposase InsO family protein